MGMRCSLSIQPVQHLKDTYQRLHCFLPRNDNSCSKDLPILFVVDGHPLQTEEIKICTHSRTKASNLFSSLLKLTEGPSSYFLQEGISSKQNSNGIIIRFMV